MLRRAEQESGGDVCLRYWLTNRRVAPVAESGGAHISQHVAILRVDRKSIESTFYRSSLALTLGTRQMPRPIRADQAGLNFEQIRRFQFPFHQFRFSAKFIRRVTLWRAEDFTPRLADRDRPAFRKSSAPRLPRRL